MPAFVSALLSLALCFSLASPDLAEPADHSKRIYVGNLPFAAEASDANVEVGVEEADPAPLRISFGGKGRMQTPIRLSPRGEVYAGRGRTPAGREVRSIRIWSEAGTLTLRFEEPPTEQGWEEGVAALRYEYDPTEGETTRGRASAEIKVEMEALGFNIGMPPSFSWGETNDG